MIVFMENTVERDSVDAWISKDYFQRSSLDRELAPPYVFFAMPNRVSGELNSRCAASALDANYLNSPAVPSASISQRPTVNS
jgi:hypothetical protein